MDWVGVDVGGTFTDAVAYDNATGSLRWSKAPSTPAAPADGVRAALDRLGVAPRDMERIVHGVTICTNAILERKGADAWFLTTRGFRDTLEIARTERRTLYDIKHLKPKPLIPRLRVLEIDERLNADGSVLQPLDQTSLATAVRTLSDENAESVAVGFLHSYINTNHEDLAVAAIGAALPRAFVSSSSDVLPEFREYERFTTTVLNAYIGPLMQRYLQALRASLRAAGYDRGVFLMTSSGGLAGAERAARYPVHTVLSGPAGGVAAGLDLGARLGIDNLITYDMGGTSTDVCLIEALAAPITGEQLIAEYPNRTPQIEINTVGAGGGSIAWVDSGDILKVGPRSAGAEPGPACYGRGGEDPTVTDANLMLRRLSPHSKLAGDMGLAAAPAGNAFARLARRIHGLDPYRLADGIVRIAVARMVSAIREISVSRGHDPRDFALLAYGGAGPMHAAFVAEELEISRVVVPPSPGNFSAFGCLISDLRHDLVKTRMMETRTAPWAEVEAEFQALESEGRDGLAGDGVASGDMVFRRAAGMRYIGQSWELSVDVRPEVKSADALEAVFREAHAKRYGHAGDGPTEIVSIRVGAIGAMSKPTFPDVAPGAAPGDALIERRQVYFDDEFQDAPVYDRQRLTGPVTTPGPLLVEEMGALTVVPPGWTAAVGGLGELSLTRTKP